MSYGRRSIDRKRVADRRLQGHLDALPLPSEFVGRINAYQCEKCGGYTVTIDVDAGVTPMFLGCRASGDIGTCDGRAVSLGYPDGPSPAHIPEPAWEWYRPTGRAFRRMPNAMQAHIAAGGLDLRKRAS